MDQKTTQSLNTYLAKLKKHITLDKVVIFGSRAWGKPTKNSDLDLVIVSKTFHKMGYHKRYRVLDQESAYIDPEIHAWGFTPEEFEAFHPQSTIGYARIHGSIFIE